MTYRPHRSRIRPLWAGVLLWLVGLLLLGASTVSAQGQHVRVLDIDGAITPPMANYVRDGIENAAESGDAVVVLRMDTPGGLSSSMDQITKAILASPVPVVVYVGPPGARAASAGVYITYAAHIAAMAPSTNIGSATPVMLSQSGEAQESDPAMTKKVVNDAVAQIRGLAEARGRNADWAEEAVREAVNITAQEALDLNVIDLIAPDLPTLLNEINGMTVQTAAGPVTIDTMDPQIVPEGMSLIEQFLQIISDPSIAYILLSLGMLGIFLELSNPGIILPGTLGGICILLALFSLGSLNVNWAGVLLMAFGFLLFIIDIFVPSHGALTIGGVAAFALGSVMLMNSLTTPGLRISKLVIVVVTVLVTVTFMVVIGLVARTRMRRAATGKEAMTGAVGVVRHRLDPEGFVFIEGELWRASSPVGTIDVGTQVRVIKVDGLHVTVVPVEADQALPATTG